MSAPACCSNGVRNALTAGIVAISAAILFVGYSIARPYLASAGVAEELKVDRIPVPAYDYGPWHAWPVQFEGRTKPLESAARETMRAITGRSKFEGKDAVSIVLMWMFTQGVGSGEQFPEWEDVPFVLADHHGMRDWVFAHTRHTGDKPLKAADLDADRVAELAAGLSEEQRHGKFVSPRQLRESPGYARLLDTARELRAEDSDKGQHRMTPEQQKAEEVANRLMAFDNLARNPLVKVGLRAPRDPVHFVQLDRVPASPWLSLGELEMLAKDPGRWNDVIGTRMLQSPQLYLSPELRLKLDAFMTALEKKEALKLVDALPGADDKGNEKFQALRRRVVQAEREAYNRGEEKYRMVHLDYLETVDPRLYINAVLWQDYPKERAERVTAAWEAARSAYKSGDAGKFAEASKGFFATVAEVSEQSLAEGWATRPEVKEAASAFNSSPKDAAAREALFSAVAATGEEAHRYPTTADVQLELTFNRLSPFMWAWLLMVPAVGVFTAAYISGSRSLYYAGFLFYLGSMAFQVFGFYARIAIAGRAPVSNMYETVIFVAFMSGVFALVLEAVYRKGVIALAGSLVSLIALVLADQLPLALDPKISPLPPVLRSNFWLLIHVLTIVASYAGGTLAWGLANVSLALIVFGKPEKDTLKTLSLFTYRAMQIAVLLLAAGTFLGGWWAAYSWGRFWGWDPKETWALISLICYVIPLHARYIGWVKDFGLAVSAVVCYAAILMCWYGVNFVLGAGLHSYGFGGGGPFWVLLAGLLNLLWVQVAAVMYLNRRDREAAAGAEAEERELAGA